MQESELIGQLQNSATRNAAFRVLSNEYAERIYWHVRRIVIMHEDADDVVQNVFIKIFRNIESFKGDSKLYTWIFRIATNESISFINKRKKKRSLSLDDGSAAYTLECLESDAYFSGDEITKSLHQAISLLPEKQKLVFQLKYFEEMSYRDMSEVLETSEGALKASFHHATNKIKQSLSKVEFL